MIFYKGYLPLLEVLTQRKQVETHSRYPVHGMNPTIQTINAASQSLH